MARKKPFWNNAIKEFKRSPISTTAALLGIGVVVYSIISGSLPFTIPILSNTHLSMTVELTPELFENRQMVNYKAKICNEISSVSSVDEIRIYKNDYYTNFTCNPKLGWETFFLPIEQACIYTATNWIYYIKPGECETFEFISQAPENGCDLTWKFESRDTNNNWMFIFDTTSMINC